MPSVQIAALRSVSLNLPDLALAETFYAGLWNLEVAHRTGDAIYLRGSGSDSYLLALHRHDGPASVRHVTLRAHSLEALQTVAQAAQRAGGIVLAAPAPLTDDPAGGTALLLRDPDGRVLQIVHGDRVDASRAERAAATPPLRSPRPGAPAPSSQPVRLTHVVLNSHDVDATAEFICDVLGFRVADRTGAHAFLNANHDHHTLAVAVADNDALNHIAFLMPDFDAVMRGAGRLKEGGHVSHWGPGRHGPGDNLFNYFIDPFGVVIEYTAEVLQIDDSYLARGPADWKWPPGRLDQWGIAHGPTPEVKEAQRRVFFAAR